MVAIESIVAKVGGRAAAYVGRVAVHRVRRQAVLEKATALIDRATCDAFLGSLTTAQSSAYLTFLESPQFEHLALRTTVWHLAGRPEDDLADIRQTARLSLRGRLGLTGDRLLTGTDLVLHLLTTTSEATIRAHKDIDSGFAVGVVADLAAAAARHHEILEGLPDLRAVDRFGRMLRAQVGATRSRMRLAQLGRRAGVEYADLHIDPTFSFPGDQPDVHRSTTEALEGFQRLVVLGDPGAGKSTFAAKLAHDLARDRLPGFAGRVPFLVVARDHADALRTSRRPFLALLEDVARDPYNVTPPPDAVEHLLLDGTAVVLVDGVDELGDAAARRRLADLVEAFAHHYPLVTVVVTSRLVGYDEAPLDDELFADIRIAPFTDRQIADYANHWFALDGQDGDLAASFLVESADVPDLRSNPLVLSLLCSVYSSRHYIPRHRTRIYEECAELLFERWDQGRGMGVPMRFGTHMRPAVARLAWQLFTEPSAGQVLSRDRVAELLIEYMLEERFDDWTEAATAATEFLDYCAGRAWLLSEMGVRDGVRVYGFTHRTFLEYFTAVQLVRSGPSPDKVWQCLADRLADASWRTVAHLAVQLLDRAYEGGGTALVELLLDAAVASPARAVHLQFGAQIATQVALRSGTLRRLAKECVRLAGEQPSRNRFRYAWTSRCLETLRTADQPLQTVLQLGLPENVDRLGAAVADALRDPEFDAADDALSFGPLDALLSSVAGSSVWMFEWTAGQQTRRHLDGRGPATSHDWATRLGRVSPEDVRRRGASVLFQQFAFGAIRRFSPAGILLTGAIAPPDEEFEPDETSAHLLEEIYRPLVDDPWPWIRARSGVDVDIWAPAEEASSMLPYLDADRFRALNPAQRSTALLLLLVMIQHVEGHRSKAVFLDLLAARRSGWGRAAAVAKVGAWGLLPEAHDLVVSWIHDTASPVLRYS